MENLQKMKEMSAAADAKRGAAAQSAGQAAGQGAYQASKGPFQTQQGPGGSNAQQLGQQTGTQAGTAAWQAGRNASWAPTGQAPPQVPNYAVPGNTMAGPGSAAGMAAYQAGQDPMARLRQIQQANQAQMGPRYPNPYIYPNPYMR